MNLQNQTGFSRSVSKKMFVLAIIVGLIIAVAVPSTYCFLMLRERMDDSRMHGVLLADSVALAIRDNEELWKYDVLILAIAGETRSILFPCACMILNVSFCLKE